MGEFSMHLPIFSLERRFFVLGIFLFAIAMSATISHAQTEVVLYNFGSPGTPLSPWTSMVSDKSGNLYGVTPNGGANHNGAIYELSPVSGGWQESILYSFTGGADGGTPYATPVFDPSGNLYGTAQTGGASKFGVVYELSPISGGSWQETVLYSFTNGKDGSYPSTGNLVFDASGNLYSSNISGGNANECQYAQPSGCGIIFQLSPLEEGKWKFHILFTLEGEIIGPAMLTFDAAGSLFGTAAGPWGGFELPSAPGAAFELTPTSSGPWKSSLVHNFGANSDVGLPSQLIFDNAGNMYGTGGDGGLNTNCNDNGCGGVFKISRGSKGWREEVLYAFTGQLDGSGPEGVVLYHGKLYGTTFGGGTDNSGVVFELASGANNTWTETPIFNFDSSTGYLPTSPPIVLPNGYLYGTTPYGGANSGGVAYELMP
jgi:uncharacterized repeat protein (TIGR03803 family)